MYKVRFPRAASQSKATATPLPLSPWDLLSDLLLGAVSAGVVDSFGKVLDEADALRDPDLLLLRQLRGQASLARRGVIHRNRHLLLKAKHLCEKPPQSLSRPSTAQYNSQSYKYLYELPLLLGNFGAIIIMRAGERTEGGI